MHDVDDGAVRALIGETVALQESGDGGARLDDVAGCELAVGVPDRVLGVKF